jgi:hypothetical protein
MLWCQQYLVIHKPVVCFKQICEYHVVICNTVYRNIMQISNIISNTYERNCLMKTEVGRNWSQSIPFDKLSYWQVFFSDPKRITSL